MCEKQGVNVTREEHATGRVEDDQLRDIKSKIRSSPEDHQRRTFGFYLEFLRITGWFHSGGKTILYIKKSLGPLTVVSTGRPE